MEQRTFEPVSCIRFSSKLNRVWHFSHMTIMLYPHWLLVSDENTQVSWVFRYTETNQMIKTFQFIKAAKT